MNPNPNWITWDKAGYCCIWEYKPRWKGIAKIWLPSALGGHWQRVPAFDRTKGGIRAIKQIKTKALGPRRKRKEADRESSKGSR